MTRKEIQMVENVMDGWQVGYVYLYPISGGKRTEVVFDLIPENIASFIYRNQHEVRKIEITDMHENLLFRIDTNGDSICRSGEFCEKIADSLLAIADGSEPAEFAVVSKSLYDRYCGLEEKSWMETMLKTLLKEAK